MILIAECERLAQLSRTALADVIVTTADGRSPAELHDCLFATYPGLTFALVVGDDATVRLGSRNGRILLVRTDGPVPLRSPWLRALALDVYAERVRRSCLSARPVA